MINVILLNKNENLYFIYNWFLFVEGYELLYFNEDGFNEFFFFGFEVLSILVDYGI